ncbi:hypothetical protein FRX31_035020 [Thalictrum thalictroides]|uniref:Uncharacterized protein n=1 Tax=Thalictrum thalictroides TaxID=46969 RepID=A0A7J6USZ3_THATH|nr:hypothetical protein FRX31_035020 [Thalictrum thalictroides]
MAAAFSKVMGSSEGTKIGERHPIPNQFSCPMLKLPGPKSQLERSTNTVMQFQHSLQALEVLAAKPTALRDFPLIYLLFIKSAQRVLEMRMFQANFIFNACITS